MNATQRIDSRHHNTVGMAAPAHRHVSMKCNFLMLFLPPDGTQLSVSIADSIRISLRLPVVKAEQKHETLRVTRETTKRAELDSICPAGLTYTRSGHTQRRGPAHTCGEYRIRTDGFFLAKEALFR